MSDSSARRLQHTVRFRTPEESRLVAMMAASAGVSTSEWIASAARKRMREWLRGSWNEILHPDFIEAMGGQLDEALAGEVDVDTARDNVTLGEGTG